MILVKDLTHQVFGWGALSGQRAIVLDLGEPGQTDAVGKDPVDLLQVVDKYAKNVKHLRIRNVTSKSLQASDEATDELFALGRAAKNRGMLVSMEHDHSLYKPWFPSVPYKIQIMPGGSRFTTECQELWYFVQSLKTEEPHGSLPQLPLMYAHFPAKMREAGEDLKWLEGCKYSWGYLLNEHTGNILEDLL